MPDVAIRVEHLSKRPRIGVAEERPDTLVGAARSWLKSPIDNDRRLTTFNNSHTLSPAALPSRRPRSVVGGPRAQRATSQENMKNDFGIMDEPVG